LSESLAPRWSTIYLEHVQIPGAPNRLDDVALGIVEVLAQSLTFSNHNDILRAVRRPEVLVGMGVAPHDIDPETPIRAPLITLRSRLAHQPSLMHFRYASGDFSDRAGWQPYEAGEDLYDLLERKTRIAARPVWQHSDAINAIIGPHTRINSATAHNVSSYRLAQAIVGATNAVLACEASALSAAPDFVPQVSFHSLELTAIEGNDLPKEQRCEEPSF
jgi:hypothetical protein